MRHLVALALVASLAACGRPDDPASGGGNYGAATGTERRADDPSVEAKKEMSPATEAAENAMNRMAAAARSAGEKVDDATITLAVNAALAKDANLSVLRIDVDTQDGRVILKGKAPDAASRDRATELATAVRGVMAVDNQLIVAG